MNHLPPETPDSSSKKINRLILIAIFVLPQIVTWTFALLITSALITPPQDWAYFSGKITGTGLIDSIIGLLGFYLARGKLGPTFEENKKKLVKGAIVAFILIVVFFFV